MKIVVAIDGSPHADRALAWAVHEAQLHSASLTALHAIHVSRLAGRDTSHEREHDAAIDLVRDALKRVAGDGGPEVGIEVPLVRGRGVAGAVLHNTRGADLVVLGSRGRGGFPGLLLGSVSQQVAAHAGVPVAVIPPDDTHPQQPAPVTSVVVGVDGSPASRSALAWGVAEARVRKIPVQAVHVRASIDNAVADVTTVDVSTLEDRAHRRAQHELSSIVDDTLGARHDAVNQRVVTGSPARVLIDDAFAPSSLLAVGSRGRGGFSGLLLGSVSQQCVTHAHGPVVVVHAP